MQCGHGVLLRRTEDASSCGCGCLLRCDHNKPEVRGPLVALGRVDGKENQSKFCGVLRGQPGVRNLCSWIALGYDSAGAADRK